MIGLVENYEIFDYLHVGEKDYLNSLKNAKENDYPLPKRPLIKHKRIGTAILYKLVNSKREKSPGKSLELLRIKMRTMK